MTHAGGRPLKFNNVQELQSKIDNYFYNCDPHTEDAVEWVQARDKSGKLLYDDNGLHYLVEISHKVTTRQIPYTITGLALALDTSRETLLDYESGKYDNGNDIVGYNPEYSDTIKKAKVKCEYFAEQMLFGNAPTGSIFNLKNNYGWKDRTEVAQTIDNNNLTDEELDKKILEAVNDKRRPTGNIS